jgi:hypothetical protein
VYYPVYPEHWDSGFERAFGFRYSVLSQDRRTYLHLDAKIGNIQSVDRSFSADTLTQTKTLHGFSQLGFGISQVIPFSRETELTLRANIGSTVGKLIDQYEYNVYGATNSEMLRTDFFRSIASISRHFSEQAHFFVEGGAGVRGYNGQPVDQTGNISQNGTDMFGFNADLRLPNPLSSLGGFASSFEFGLFTDAGWAGDLEHGSPAVGETFTDIRHHLLTDAGISVKINPLSWLPWQLHGVVQEYGHIPMIDLYFPIYLNHPFDGKGNFSFRYVIGIGSTFRI